MYLSVQLTWITRNVFILDNGIETKICKVRLCNWNRVNYF
jgi:hypothetical protein